MCMRSDSRVFQFASHTFDASVMEILSCLIVGGCVCIPSEQDRMNDIPGAITRMGVTWTLLTPSVANTLTPKRVPTLKVLVTGGEAMSSGHIAKWKGKMCLINAYGPSETSVIATTSMKVDEAGNEICSDTSSIGRAVGGRNWIVDPRNYNKLVPVGAIGELVVEGRIVARGYLNNEQKTAQAFISHPEWLKGYQHQERMYRTGDLVRYNSDGSLSFVARKDTQIKLNGQRIELGEIEHNVKTFLPEDSQSAVELVAPMSRVATKALAVFFCLDNALEIGNEDEKILGGDEILLPMSKVARRVAKNLDSSLAGVLPTYMIPSFYIPVTKMPWTSSGKLDRTRLRNIVATLPKEATGPYRLAVSENKISTTPATVMEQKLQRLWESVINAGPPGSISVDDNFFRLGGDSVTAMKLVGAAKLDGISLTVIDIFRNPKLSDMASVCGALEEEAQTELKEFALLKSGDNLNSVLDEIVEQCRIDRDSIQDAYPCSLLQEGLLTLSLKQGGAYTAHNVFRLPAEIDINKFKGSWQVTVDEVDILRTRIVHMESSAFIQVVEKPRLLVWENFRSLQDINIDEIQLPTHNGGCLTQYTIVDAEDSEDHFFIWSIHHALYDGWSMPMVLQRVESAYLDSVSSFPKSSYASFIKYLTEMDMPASDDFWRTRLANASPLQFPQTIARADEQTRSNQMLSHSISISADVAGLDVTVPTIIRAAWSMIIATYSGSNDVVFGETLAGRDIPVTGITDIIGPIFTTVPTRIQVDREMTIAQFLKGVHQMATEIIPYQHAGLQRIKRLDSDTELACDFQNLLVIQTAEEETEDEFWTLLNEGVSSNFFTYPLVLECKASPDLSKVDINAHFDANVISNWGVERLLFQLDSVLKQLTQLSATTNAEVKRTLADVVVFSPEDRLLVQEWSSDELRLVDSCVHEEFEKIALSQPSALALDSWDGQFTYCEVREHAMRLAHHLIELGVGPEIVVPICMDKSAWAVISMLGVMFAGGAYCPLDPAAPLSRHQDMMQDIKATLIICTPKYAERYSGLIQKILPLDSDAVARIPIRAQQDHMLHRATSQNPIYVLFTSGSTGKPKGTMIEHRAFMTSSLAMREILLMSPTDRVFQFGSYTFDVSVLEIHTTLTFGGCICIPSEDTRTRDVAEAIVTLNINWSFLTPSVANLIEPSLVTSCLKTLVCGGEAMSLENVVKWAPHVTLVNAYGPTEASVIGLVNQNISQQRDPTNVGFPLAGNRAWIADPEDHNRITPVGSTGELLLEGPILAREYINNPEKTAAAFIENPAWTSIFGDTRSTTRRMYKTGDLVKYNEDGSFTFIGRKDNQVKLHGQRMELGEIENNLDIDPQIQHAVVALPKIGHFKKRLVAVLSLTEIGPIGITTEVCQIVQEGPRGILARTEATKARNRLSERLPAYMVPATWIVIESIPFLASGKLDRRSVVKWLETIDERTYEQIMEADDEEDSTIPATDTAKMLQHIFSRVLNLPLPRVKLGSSFMSLGGDSITAMQVMALCRKEKINFSLSEVLRSKSIHQLAANARFEGDTVFQDEKVDQLFDLSPVQQLYFQSESADEQRPGSRFNQSFSLQITHKVEAETLNNAINTIVNQHSMLRARFVKNKNGTWQQHITQDAPSSYRFQVHNVNSVDDLPLIVGQSQTSLDIQQGPLFAVDLFNIGGANQMVFLAAHHLVIDMMSWRIILGDLEEILKTGTLTSDKPLSFQVWNSLQTEHSQMSSAGDHNKVLPFKVSPVNKKYWGMDTRKNTYDDVISEAFTISEEITALALGEANTSLRTEPMDIFLSAIAHSFSRVFVDRGTPPVFTEGHGRESWDASIDISRTVGWFTTIFPIQVEVESEEDDVVDTVRRMKDTRHKVPDNGRPYFAYRFLTPEGKAQCKDHDGPMEIIFNYLGRMQQLEHDDSLLQQFEYPEDESNSKLTADVGPEATRFAFFEISAAVVRDKIQFSFLFNKEMKHQQEIHRWIAECQSTLEETVQRLASIKGDRIFTLSDFPLLPISYDGLEKIVTKSLPEVGITHDMVEDIYPAAPLQEGLILSQIKDPSLYHFHAVFEVNPTSDGTPIDGQKLLKAWQKVVDRHGALRTVFADSVYKGDIFSQIVVKKAETGAILLQCKDDEVLEKLSKISILDLNYQRKPRLPHQITVCEASSGKVYFKAEINHGVIDGGSANIMLRDLAAAYHDRLPDGSGPLYSDYVGFIKSQSSAAGTKFWKSYLEGARACHFPTLNKEAEPEKKLASIQMVFDRFPELQDMCKRMKVTFANVMQAAWALCLRKYTKSEDVCFGNLTSGRDVPVDGIQDTIGAFINMLVVRVKFSKQSTVKEMYQKVQSDYLQSLEHQHTQLGTHLPHSLYVSRNYVLCLVILSKIADEVML
jgi:amino acid adenylation domain-containing protein/non-ribosomal peptide synthase protein (TIGR01720 family)